MRIRLAPFAFAFASSGLLALAACVSAEPTTSPPPAPSSSPAGEPAPQGAAAKTPGLLTSAQQKSIVDEALSKQQADGGFSLSSFVGGWKRRDNTPLETRSDGYATGVVTYALRLAGISKDDPQMKRGMAWLVRNQNKTEGHWLAYSLNKQRDLSSDVGRFMSDAATAQPMSPLVSA